MPSTPKPAIKVYFTAALLVLTIFVTLKFLGTPTLFAPTYQRPLVEAGDYWRVFAYPFLQPDLWQLVLSSLTLFLVGSALEAGLGAFWLALAIFLMSPAALIGPGLMPHSGWALLIPGLVAFLLIYAKRTRQGMPQVTLVALGAIHLLVAVHAGWPPVALLLPLAIGIGLGSVARPVKGGALVFVAVYAAVVVFGVFRAGQLPARTVSDANAGLTLRVPAIYVQQGSSLQGPGVGLKWTLATFPQPMSVVRDKLILGSFIPKEYKLERLSVEKHDPHLWVVAQMKPRTTYAWTAAGKEVLQLEMSGQPVPLQGIRWERSGLKEQSALEQASELIENGRLAEAEKILEQHPQEPEFRLMLGVLRKNVGDLRAAAALAPDDPRPPANLAMLALQSRRWEQALEFSSRALELAPKGLVGKTFLFDQHHARALALLGLGRAKEALAEVEKALALEVGEEKRQEAETTLKRIKRGGRLL